MLPLIGLCGKAGAGKDVAGAYLVEKYGYRRTAFADTLKKEVAQALGGVDVLAYMEQHKRDDVSLPTGWPRGILQNWGMARRDLGGPDYWINQTTLVPGICVTDVRFANEVAAIKAAGGILIRINRNTKKVSLLARIFRKKARGAHPSEAAIDGLKVDFDVDNTGTLTYLYKQLDDIVQNYE